MIERIIDNFEWLYKLVYSTKRQYPRLIDRASGNNLRAILACLDLYNNTYHLLSLKELISPVRLVGRQRAVQIFKENYKLVRGIVLLVILRLVKAAVEDVLRAQI